MDEDTGAHMSAILKPLMNLLLSDNYSKVCMITTDLSKVPLSPRLGAEGTFYRIDLDIILLFGLTEFKAQVAWKEDGVEKR